MKYDQPIYIYFVSDKQRHGPLDLTTKEVAEGVNIDYLPNGEVAGVEVLDYKGVMIDGNHVGDMLLNMYNAGYKAGRAAG